MISSINLNKNDAKTAGIGAAGGVAVGAGAGAAVGLIKTNGIMQNFKVDGAKLAKDTYVNSRIKANEEGIKKAFKENKWAEKLGKVAKKAGEDFDKAFKTSKNTKIKHIAGMAAAGLAIGAAIGLVANKVKENNSAADKFYC